MAHAAIHPIPGINAHAQAAVNAISANASCSIRVPLSLLVNLSFDHS